MSLHVGLCPNSIMAISQFIKLTFYHILWLKTDKSRWTYINMYMIQILEIIITECHMFCVSVSIAIAMYIPGTISYLYILLSKAVFKNLLIKVSKT